MAVALVSVFAACSFGSASASNPDDEVASRYPEYQDVSEVDGQLGLGYSAVEGYQDADYDAAYYSCMQEAGFDIPNSVRPTRAAASGIVEDIVATPRIERVALDEVAKLGYDAVPDDAPPADPDSADLTSEDPLSLWISSLTPTEQQRYSEADLGTGAEQITVVAGDLEMSMPADGCETDALRASVGDVEEWLRLTTEVNDLNLTIINDTDSNPEYVEALAAWQACVAERGFNITDEGDQSGTVEQAVQDRACRDEVGLTDARGRARLAAANKVRERLNVLAIDAQALIDQLPPSGQ